MLKAKEEGSSRGYGDRDRDAGTTIRRMTNR
jgi:hypothetical protein